MRREVQILPFLLNFPVSPIFLLFTRLVSIKMRRSRTYLTKPYVCNIIAVHILPKELAMPTRKLTVRLPDEDIDFAKQFAARHGLTLTQLIDRYFKQLQQRQDGPLHRDIVRFSGIIPAEIDPQAEYAQGMENKHR